MEETPIDILVCVKNRLETIPLSHDNIDFFNSLQEKEEYIFIIENIKQYLRKYCKHNMVEDLIDITPDKSVKIYYCSKCEYTL